jgi:hypothetical protein
VTSPRRWSVDAGDGLSISACGSAPPDAADRPALAEIARAAAARYAAERHPALTGLADAIFEIRRDWFPDGLSMRSIAVHSGASVRPADVSAVLQASPQARARAANLPAEWAGW